MFLFVMSDPLMEPYPHQFATALFSFLYHLASYDAGGEALVSCGMMEALLKVSVSYFAYLRLLEAFSLSSSYLQYHDCILMGFIAQSR